MTISREDVILAYRFFLGREPESEAAVTSKMDAANFGEMRKAFLHCPEFIHKERLTRFPVLPLDVPEIEVDTDATPKQLAAALANIKAAWSHLGFLRPHFSVLTDRQYLPENLDGGIDKFWASGEAEAAQAERILANHKFTGLSDKTCVEFGCGVGRVTMGLARRFKLVHGYDISAGHLAHAERQARYLGMDNIILHECAENLLEKLNPCDFFYSRIVFQHNPPIIIAELIKCALAALRPGGMAIFQVPTYQLGYRFRIKEWLKSDHELDMQMHCLPQYKIFEIINGLGCVALEIREDNSTGQPDRFISNTFVIRKRG